QKSAARRTLKMSGVVEPGSGYFRLHSSISPLVQVRFPQAHAKVGTHQGGEEEPGAKGMPPGRVWQAANEVISVRRSWAGRMRAPHKHRNKVEVRQRSVNGFHILLGPA